MDHSLADTTDKLAPVLDHGGAYAPNAFALSGRLGRLRYFVYGVTATLCATTLLSGLYGRKALSIEFTPDAADAAMSLPIYSVMVFINFVLARRRLNDMGHSGWLSVLLLVPFLNAVAGLCLLFVAGGTGPNRFDPPAVPNTRKTIAAAWLVSVLFIALHVAIPLFAD